MIELNDDNFQETISRPGKVLVEFGAIWCNPCQQLLKKLEEISQQIPEVTFAKFEATRESSVVIEYGIRAVPTLVLFENGTAVKTKPSAGTLTQQQVIDFIG